MSGGAGKATTDPVQKHEGLQDDAGNTGKTTEITTCAQSTPPSHILQDGRFIYLPEPSPADRSKFLERSIARHQLLLQQSQEDEDGSKQKKENGDDSKETESTTTAKEKSTQPRVHPLAVASARLQSHGISELSKAINLTGLVGTGEYFGLSNIVNPLLEDVKKTDASSAAASVGSINGTAGTNGTAASTQAAVADAALTSDVQTDLTMRACYLGKRKRSQFTWATEALTRQERRVAAAVATQQLLDVRLFALRPQWRLVAPEHGTRAKAHSTRPTEIIAIDVDVYDTNHHTANDTNAKSASVNQNHHPSLFARRVPRYATVELPKDYKVKEHVKEWKALHAMEDSSNIKNVNNNNPTATPTNNSVSLKIDPTAVTSTAPPTPTTPTFMSGATNTTNRTRIPCKTRAEPFAVADPTLGKIDVDFDPNKVPMLSLQLDITKDSTGFCQSADLDPLTTLGEAAHEDEKVVVALQRSLFCASLFESIRRELLTESSQNSDGSQAAMNDKNGGNSSTNRRHDASMKPQHENVWLSSQMEENYLPSPSLLADGQLSVVHCHEGEIKVMLDSEYALTIKLVEANPLASVDSTTATDNNNGSSLSSKETPSVPVADTGSLSPEQLHVLCRALLLHAQNVYHDHSIKIRTLLAERAAKKAAAVTAKNTTATINSRNAKPMVSYHGSTTKKEEPLPQAHILQDCVSLGVKMILERKVRWALTRVQTWLFSQNSKTTQSPPTATDTGDDNGTNDNSTNSDTNHHSTKFMVEWLPLSIFIPQSRFVLSFRGLSLDVLLERDTIILTRFGDNGEYRTVKFHDEKEFELHLQLELRKRL